MATTIGLPDTIRGHLGLAAAVVLVIQAYLLGQAALGQEPPIPAEIVWAIGLIAAVLVAIRDYGGVRDATTARVAKEQNGSLEQHRAIPKQKP